MGASAAVLALWCLVAAVSWRPCAGAAVLALWCLGAALPWRPCAGAGPSLPMLLHMLTPYNATPLRPSPPQPLMCPHLSSSPLLSSYTIAFMNRYFAYDIKQVPVISGFKRRESLMVLGDPSTASAIPSAYAKERLVGATYYGGLPGKDSQKALCRDWV